jgi:hypothetical protein
MVILLAMAPDAVACPGPEVTTVETIIDPSQMPMEPAPKVSDNLELNTAFLFFSVFGLLGTLYMLLKKQSSMWIIGGAMMALFAFIGFMCV